MSSDRPVCFFRLKACTDGAFPMPERLIPLDAQQTLAQYFGFKTFRPGQAEIIQQILNGRDVLGIMPTGAGKSICFQVPALMLPGITLVVSPLISLMIDQVKALLDNSVPAAYINGSLTETQIAKALARAEQGAYKIIYAAPERLNTYAFRKAMLAQNISMVVVDEAHCVSLWGHEFRPEYRRITEFIHALPRRPRLAAFTATATEVVRQDIVNMLELQDPFRLVTSFDRPNLFFEVIQPLNKNGTLLYLLKALNGQSGIVYCLSRKDVEETCAFLNERGISATRYHAGLPDKEKAQNQDDFQFDRKQIMVATNAFGMGIDKSNVRSVIHHSLPLSMEAYYQEAGRAGRDGLPSQCILLYDHRDTYRARYLIDHTVSNPNLSDEENALLHDRSVQRFEDMIQYCTAPSCLRHQILDYFGESSPEACTTCSCCAGTRFPRLHTLPRLTRVSRSEPQPEKIRRIPDLFEALLQEPDDDYGLPSLHLSEYSLKRPAEPAAPKPARKPAVSYDLSANDNTLFARLYKLRSELAENRNMPPFVICSDATLRDLAAKLPQTLPQMDFISGLSPAKIRSYGQAILSVIREWLDEHPADGDCQVPESWTEEEKQALLRLLQSKESVYSISISMKKPEEEVARVCRMYMAEPESAASTKPPKPARPARAKSAPASPRPRQTPPAPLRTPYVPGRSKTPRPWKQTEINWLRSLHAEGREVGAIATQMGRRKEEIEDMLEELGLI